MGFFERIFESRSGLRNILIAKLILLGVAILVLTKQLHFGDMPMLGEDAGEGDKSSSAAETARKRTAAAAADGGTSSSTQGSQRRGYLDGLLNLPSFDRNEPKREELARFLDLADQKERQVRERLAILEKREQYLQELEKVVEEKLKSLDDERVLFEQSIQREKSLEEERVTALGEFYKKMEPKKAAPVFEKMDHDLVVKLFKMFPQKQVTNILSAMNPDKSVEISEYFGRVRSGKEYEMLREMNHFLVEKFEQCKGMPEQNPSAGTAQSH